MSQLDPKDAAIFAKIRAQKQAENDAAAASKPNSNWHEAATAIPGSDWLERLQNRGSAGNLRPGIEAARPVQGGALDYIRPMNRVLAAGEPAPVRSIFEGLEERAGSKGNPE